VLRRQRIRGALPGHSAVSTTALLPRRQAYAPLVASTRARVESHHPTRPGVCIGKTSDCSPRCLPGGPHGSHPCGPAPLVAVSGCLGRCAAAPLFLGGEGQHEANEITAGPAPAGAATTAAFPARLDGGRAATPVEARGQSGRD